MAVWFQFKLSEPLDEVAREQIAAQIPGAKVETPWTVLAANNAAWLVDRWLRGVGLHSTMLQLVTRARIPFTFPPAELRPGAFEEMMPYQREGARWACEQQDAALIWTAGSGKTLGAIAWALACSGRVVFVTRSGARESIAKQWRFWTTIKDPQVIEEQRAVESFHSRVVIIGWELLPFHATALRAAKFTSIVFDEIHRCKSHKRWDPRVGEDGELTFSKKENVAAAAMDLSRAAKRRLATTATPLKDRVRDLWAQLDLIQPNQWGKYWTWAARYCGATPSPFGGLDDKGRAEPAIMEELKRRLSFVWHRVPYSVSHRQVPPLRNLVTYLKPEEQVRGRSLKNEIRGAAQRRDSSALLEILLAEAATRKRPRILDAAEEVLRNGGKVVLFTGRRMDVDDLGEGLSKRFACTIYKAWGVDAIPIRERYREAYMQHAGPCALVTTIDSMGESVNLHDTDYAGVAQLPWNGGTLHQVKMRFHRLGQKRPCLIEFFVAEGTVDERLAAILIDKLPAVEHLVGDELLAEDAARFAGDPEELKQSLLEKILKGGAHHAAEAKG